MITSPWDGGTRLYEMALDVRSAVHETIAANMANEETPGYKARHLPFKETLTAVLDNQFPLDSRQTNSSHLSPYAEQDRIHSHTIVDKHGSGLDENTVNLEREMTGMAENTLLYMAVSQFLGGRFDGWRAAIDEGRR